MMRALRVIGLEEDGKSVILEDPERGERFVLPADERLRAAARGDLTRLGQIEIEVESQMRPREIQARIRAGESIEQVAAAAGIPTHRVERFAYPVLLERSRTAELAQRAHPVREDGPDVQTLGEVVAHSFGLRGQDYTDVSWDSWRGEDGRWVVQLHWTAGRSDNRAHWAFHPGAHGGTVTALDDAAVELMDPNPNRTLRTVRPVTQLARQALELEKPAEPEILVREEPLPTPPPAPEPEPEPVVVEEPPAPQPTPAPAPAAAKKDPQPPKRGKKNHPIVPSWEDVLLGVRSNRG
nr:septation protein SepH [Saccharothrix mutabilis subsp. capreolus]